jgi:NAD(P)-dependent dehydrogenase (short-subunit alcohol dehydrogenase family)
MTDALRQELAPRGIHVTAVQVGYMDTDMAAFAPADQKTDPATVAELALDGLLAGESEVLADDLTRATKAQLSGTQNDRSHGRRRRPTNYSHTQQKTLLRGTTRDHR